MLSSKYRKKRYILLQTVQWMLFALCILVCYVLETSGSYQKPLLLIPLALCISSHTGEIQAMAVGTVCGLLLDLACGKLVGYNAIWLVISCTIVSLLYRYLFKQKLWNMLFLTTICAFIQGGMDYIFYYAIWEHENVDSIFRNMIVPSCMMTVASSVLFYFLIHRIAEKCGNHRIQKLERIKFSDLD